VTKKYSRPHTKPKSARTMDYRNAAIGMMAAAQDDDMNSLSSEEPAEELTSMSLGMPAPRVSSPGPSPDLADMSNAVSPKFKIPDTVKKKIRLIEPAGSSPSVKSRPTSGKLSKLPSPNSPEMRPKSPFYSSSRGGSPPDGASRAQSPPGLHMATARPAAVATSSESAKTFSVAASRRIEMNSGLGTIKRSIAHSVFRPPFALIQLHRERLKMRPILGSRRPLRCYLRVCAMVGTCNEAKIAAEAQLFNLSIQAMNSTSDFGNMNDRFSLIWSRFSGFSTMPLQNTDHFIIYCRGAPVEFASFTPPIGTDILDSAFPSVCRAAGQAFSCLSVFRVAAQRPQNVLSSNDLPIVVATHGGDEMRSVTLRDSDAVVKPLFMKEMSCVAEVMAVSASRLDCLRYAFSLVEGVEAQQASSSKAAAAERRNRWTSVPDSVTKKLGLVDLSSVAEQRLVVVPMYAWLHISEDTFQYYDHAEFSADEIAEENRFVTAARSHMLPRTDMVVAKSELDGLDASGAGKEAGMQKSKSVTEELKDAINAVGKMLNEGTDKLKAKADNRRANNYESTGQLSNSASAAILSKEKDSRALYSVVDGRMKQTKSDNSQFPTSLSKSPSANQTAKAKLQSSGSVDSLEERLQALNSAVSSRKKVLSMNDELCHLEMRLAKQAHRTKPPAARLALSEESVITFDPNGILTGHKNELENDVNPYDLKLLQKQLSSKRVEVFGALHDLPCRGASSSFDNMYDTTPSRRAAFPSFAKTSSRKLIAEPHQSSVKKMSSIGSDHSSIINLDGPSFTSQSKVVSAISTESISGKLTAMESLFSL
jgi:hypothetical protein